MTSKPLMMTLAAALMAGVWSLPATPARADDDAATAAYLRTVTVMNLDGEARRTVSQDRVQATLTYQATGKTAAEAQAEVNRKMAAGLALANKKQGVKVSTGGYNAWKQYPSEPGPKPLSDAEREKTATWVASQSLQLDAADKEALLGLSGALQEQGFALQGMNFYLSREASDKLKDELTVEALKQVQDRAKTIAASLGLPNVHLARITVNGGGPIYRPMMAMAMAKGASAEAMPAPVGQAGESDVSVNVNVEVHLSK
jgi:predicted secreted protein